MSLLKKWILIQILATVHCDLQLISIRSVPNPPIGVDITNKVFRGSENENFLPAAYGDFNLNRHIDIVAVDSNRTTVTIFFAKKDAPFMQRGPSWNFTEHSEFNKINSVVMGDFSGDGWMDLMITTSKHHSPFKNVTIECFNKTENKTTFANVTYTFETTQLIFCIGSGESFSNCTLANKNNIDMLVQEPTILDVNRDMILDIVGEHYEFKHLKSHNSSAYNATCNYRTEMPVINKIKGIWQSENGRPAEKYSEFGKSTNHSFVYPSSNAYVDVDADFIPELVLWVNTSQHKHNQFLQEVYDMSYDSATSNLKLSLKRSANLNDSVGVLGQPLYIDLNRNGELVNLIPYCKKKECDSQSGLLIQDKTLSFQQISLCPINFDGLQWNFIPPQAPLPFNTTITTFSNESTFDFKRHSHEDLAIEFYSKSLVIQSGDYNLDGYPDLITVLEAHSGAKRYRRAVIFENIQCLPSETVSCHSPRTFLPNFKFLEGYENVTSASFFDVKENGILDVILVQESESETLEKKKKYAMRVIETNPNIDSYFIKAMVLSGRPCPSCNKDVSYGNIIPGALIQYKMKDVNGNSQTAIASQAYRSGYTMLDTPYTIFGIGHSPKFVEHLNASLGYRFEKNTKIFSHDFHQVIPNSQIIFIPSYPIEENSKVSWKTMLFLTPSDAVLHTFGVLIAIIAVMGALAGGLEYKERRVDKRERMDEARRFLM